MVGDGSMWWWYWWRMASEKNLNGNVVVTRGRGYENSSKYCSLKPNMTNYTQAMHTVCSVKVDLLLCCLWCGIPVPRFSNQSLSVSVMWKT